MTPITGGGGEIVFAVADNDMVEVTYTDWGQRCIFIAQVPAGLDFVYTFVALDTDGHFLRVFAPAE